MYLRFTNILLLLLSLLACGSCVYDDFGACPGEDVVSPDGKEQYVTLDLKININDGISPSSRAGADVNDYGELDSENPFSGPFDQYEKVNTLRVVIVREDGTIEHNRMVTIKDNYDKDERNAIITSGDIINDNLQFKIVAGEKKTIYLFANERAVNENKMEKEKFDFHSRLVVGSEFPIEDVSNILIKRVAGTAFINNNGDGHKTYIPMSEYFEITIPPFEDIQSEIIMNPSGVAEKYLNETLFITRSLIKFSFSVKLKEGANMDELKDINLVGVSISKLANEGFYLPKATDYSPGKGEKSDKEFGGREIVRFKVPDNPGASECNFIFDTPLSLTSEGIDTNPLIYLPESQISADDNYELTLKFNNDDLNKIYGSKPLAIKNIPRNTHVKINIIIGPILDVTVTVLPYTGVWLNPTFGIDRVEPVTGIEIVDLEDEQSLSNISMRVGEQINLAAKIIRADTDNSNERSKYISWSSFDDEIATVTPYGESGEAILEAISPGNTAIIATYFNGKSSYCTVTVTE